jgi:hypothetical protein
MHPIKAQKACSLLILHLFTSDGTARIPSMSYHGAGDWLKPVEGIQDNALMMSVFVVFVPSELATCSKPQEPNSTPRQAALLCTYSFFPSTFVMSRNCVIASWRLDCSSCNSICRVLDAGWFEA